MKVLFYSPAFHPNMGGLENFVTMVAEGFTTIDCQVKVVTITEREVS